MPGVAFVGLAIELAEPRGVDTGRRGGDVRVRRGRDPDPGRIHQSAPFPDAAVEIELTDLEEIPGPQERASPQIALAVGHQVPVIATEPERARQGPIE